MLNYKWSLILQEQDKKNAQSAEIVLLNIQVSGLLTRGEAMFGFGFQELLILLVIVVILFGATRLPALGKGLGEAIRNFKKSTSDPDEIETTRKISGDKKDVSTNQSADTQPICPAVQFLNSWIQKFCKSFLVFLSPCKTCSISICFIMKNMSASLIKCLRT